MTMPMQNEWVEVGRVKEAHGIRGDIYVVVSSGDVSWLADLESLKLVPKDKDVSSINEDEIEKIRVHKDGFVVKLKSCLNRNIAEEKKGMKVFIPSELFVSEEGEEIFLSEIMGFSVQLAEQSIGKVIGFYNRPAYDSLQIHLSVDFIRHLGRPDLESMQQVDIEVPLVEDFVTEIDYDLQKVHLELPEGLIEFQLPTLREDK